MLLSTGEQVTMSLLSMALHDLGCSARSYTGGQVKILTDTTHTKARIREIDDVNIRKDIFRVDVSSETLSRSTMGHLSQGDRVNLERALRFSDRLGGHLVSGHVDGMGRILKKEQKQKSWLLRIGMDEGLSKYTIEKGSIALDGISLTINRCQDAFVEVNIIPQTGKATIILTKKVGDLINIETDLIGKYVERFFIKGKASGPSGSTVIDKEMLTKFGFGD